MHPLFTCNPWSEIGKTMSAVKASGFVKPKYMCLNTTSTFTRACARKMAFDLYILYSKLCQYCHCCKAIASDRTPRSHRTAQIPNTLQCATLFMTFYCCRSEIHNVCIKKSWTSIILNLLFGYFSRNVYFDVSMLAK